MNECYINIFKACILFINTVSILQQMKLKHCVIIWHLTWKGPSRKPNYHYFVTYTHA